MNENGIRGTPGRIAKCGVAKATLVKNRRAWKLYWQHPSRKWQRYEPGKEFRRLEELLGVVDKDKGGLFYG